MSHPNGPSAAVVLPAALVVVVLATIAGGMWGAKGFVATCLVGSILAGLVVTGGE